MAKDNVIDIGLIDLTLQKKQVIAVRKTIKDLLKIYDSGGLNSEKYTYYMAALIGNSIDNANLLRLFISSTQMVEEGE